MARALRKPKVMDAATGTCDCRTLAAGERRRGSLSCQHGSSLSGGKERGPEGAGAAGVQRAPSSTREWGTGCFALAQAGRQGDSGAFVSAAGKRGGAGGQTLLQKAPPWAGSPARIPGAARCRSSLAAGGLTQEEAACGTGSGQTCLDGGAGWMDLFCAGDNAKRKGVLPGGRGAGT